MQSTDARGNTRAFAALHSLACLFFPRGVFLHEGMRKIDRERCVCMTINIRRSHPAHRYPSSSLSFSRNFNAYFAPSFSHRASCKITSSEGHFIFSSLVSESTERDTFIFDTHHVTAFFRENIDENTDFNRRWELRDSTERIIRIIVRFLSRYDRLYRRKFVIHKVSLLKRKSKASNLLLQKPAVECILRRTV